MSLTQMSRVWKLAPEQTPTPADRLILLALADIADDAGKCWPGIGYIVEKCGVSRSTVQASVKRLQEKGLLEIEQRKQEQPVRFDTNLYRLHLQPTPILTPHIPNSTPPPMPKIGHNTSCSDTSCTPHPPPTPKGGTEAEAPKEPHQKTPFDTIVYPMWQAWGKQGWVKVPRPGSKEYDLRRKEVNKEWEGKYPIAAIWPAIQNEMAKAHFIHEDWHPGMELLTRCNHSGALMREALIQGNYRVSKAEKAAKDRQPATPSTVPNEADKYLNM